MLVVLKRVFLLEYRIRWEVDGQDNFKKWYPPQFLMDAMVVNGSIDNASLYWNSKGVVGVCLKSGTGGEFMINFDEL